MSLIPGAMSGGAAVLPDRIAIPISADAHGDEGEAQVIRLRSERLPFLPGGAPPARRTIHAPGLVVEPLGPETLVTLDLAGLVLHVKVPPRGVRRPSVQARPAIAPDCVHLFDRDTGHRL
jgi:hypothetical protein